MGEHRSIERQLPRLKDGRFLSRDCPRCGCGTLQLEQGHWICDGLVDPEDPNKPLEACTYSVIGGEVYG